MVEEYHRLVPTHASASAVGYMFVPLVYQGRRINDEAWMIAE
jgi:hypothetical protein